MPDKTDLSLMIEPRIGAGGLAVLVGGLLSIVTGVLWWTLEKYEKINLQNNIQSEAIHLTKHIVEETKTFMPEGVALFFFLLSLLTTFIVYLLQKANVERWLSLKAQKKLEAEIQERHKTEQELQKTEEILKKSEAKVRLLLNSTAEAIYGIDLQGNCTFANPSCLRMTGYTDISQLLGKNMHNLIHHSYADGRLMPVELCRIFKAFLVGKGEHVVDEVLWRADGTSFPAEFWSFPQIENGKVLGAVVTFNDITERKQADDALIASRKQYQELVETLHDWVWEVDLEGRYTYVGPQVKKILGFEPGELLGKSPFDLMPPEESQRVFEIFSAHTREGKPVLALENRNFHKDGHEVLLETNGFPFFDARGKLKGYRGADRDITKHKEAERALRQSEEKFSGAFQTSPYAIVISSMEDGRFIEVNDAFSVLTGYSRDEVINQTSMALKLWANEKDREEVLIALLEGHAVADREFCFRKKNGVIGTGLFSCRRLQLKEGECLLSSISDITERKQIVEDLRSNRRFLSELIENSGNMICVKDKEGRYELINSKWEQITGFKRENSLGRTDAELFPGPVGFQFRENDLEVMRSESILEKEEILEDAHGKRFFISVKFPLRDDEGKIRGICAMINEITERKYAEKLLSLERQRLSFIIEGTQLGTWEWNIKTGKNLVNER